MAKRCFLTIILLISLTMFFSCQNADNSPDITEEGYLTHSCIGYKDKTNPRINFYTNKQIAIVEVGKSYPWVNNTGEFDSGEYHWVLAKYVKTFEKTGVYRPDFKENLRDMFLDYAETQLEQSDIDYYDIAFIVHHSIISCFEEGASYLLSINDFNGANYKNIEPRVWAIPIDNGRLSLEKELNITSEENRKTMVEHRNRINDYFLRLGLGDKLFRDGMTVDELEEYYDLVTDYNTFAPLFETETGDQSFPFP